MRNIPPRLIDLLVYCAFYPPLENFFSRGTENKCHIKLPEFFSLKPAFIRKFVESFKTNIDKSVSLSNLNLCLKAFIGEGLLQEAKEMDKLENT